MHKHHHAAHAKHPHPSAHKSEYEIWQAYVNQAVNNDAWNVYDCEIQMAVTQFNNHLIGTTGYRSLDWKFIKAMAWVETGADARHNMWNVRPLQIGNVGDPGLAALLGGKEGGDLIIPPIMKPFLSKGLVHNQPRSNIRAGIAYLLMRMASFGMETTSEGPVTEVKVKAGDTGLDELAKANGSTLKTVELLNPALKGKSLHVGQVVKVQKSSTQKTITHWMPITSQNAGLRYNKGDKLYAKKLDYAYSLIVHGKVAVCVQ